jgi:hypothetical protein
MHVRTVPTLLKGGAYCRGHSRMTPPRLHKCGRSCSPRCSDPRQQRGRARILRENAARFGRTADYTMYDQADMRHVIE